MTWHAYQVIFRLRSPLHIGWGKIGNLQRTRSYVTGRVLWGALTMRLTRDMANGQGPAIDSRDYQSVGQEVHQSLAFTYFYLATKSRNGYQVAWSWPDEGYFRHRFLSSYSGTALTYPSQSAATGMLHEVEFISPNALDSGEQVFLHGYLFENESCKLPWRAALRRLQLGGERGYGWGDVELIDVSRLERGDLFGARVMFNGEGNLPTIQLADSEQLTRRLLAHARATNLPAEGEVEPLVGREWRSNNLRHRYAGQHVALSAVCFAPGSTVGQGFDFAIGEFGVWQVLVDLI